MELEDPKDLRARVRKFLILTNERKKMSKTTLRKRISLVTVTALTAGALSVVATPVANAQIAAQNTIMITAGAGLKVATGDNTTGATTTSASSDARSLGLIYKDASTTTAQTATVIAGGALVLIGHETAATSQAFTATGGSFSTPVGGGGTQAATSAVYNIGSTEVLLSSTNATAVAVRWAAPTTPGTYTLSLIVSTNTTQFTTLATKGDGTVRGNVTVTVVASAAAVGAPVVANSTCFTADSGTLTSSDTSTVIQNGNSIYVNTYLRDAYLSPISASGNIVVTSSSPDAYVSIGSGSHSAGTSSTAVAYGNATTDSTDSVRVSQATAGKPVTTTITITYNGTTICTKSVTIRGAADSMVIANVGTAKTSNAGAANAAWLADGTTRDGHFTVTLRDSAGNTVLPSASTEFGFSAATVTSNVVTSVTFDNGDQATSLSSSLPAWQYSVGKYTCGTTAGTTNVTVTHTSATTGKVVSATLPGRCAGDAYTYTASFDKAAYNQGEIATLTVSFKDSRGNAANSDTAPGAAQFVIPMMTFVTATGSATALPKANGDMVYTLTVGTSTGMTSGTYSGIIDFTSLTAVAATKQTVTYKLSTGGDTTTNADVLKSIVALIASINKQIQALQKLILKR
jgi:hypothetical protein